MNEGVFKMNNTLLGNVKVGDMVQFCCKVIKVAKIQYGMPNGLVIGYDKYNNRIKIPFKNC